MLRLILRRDSLNYGAVGEVVRLDISSLLHLL